MRAHLQMNVDFFAHIRVGVRLLCVCWPARLRVCEFCLAVEGCACLLQESGGFDSACICVCVCVCARARVCVYVVTCTSCPGGEAVPINPAFSLWNLATAPQPGSFHLQPLSDLLPPALRAAWTLHGGPVDGVHPFHKGVPTPHTRPLYRPSFLPVGPGMTQ